MSSKNLSKKKTTSKKPDISDYGIEIKYIPLDEHEENQRLRQLCFLLFQDTIEEIKENTDINLTSV